MNKLNGFDIEMKWQSEQKKIYILYKGVVNSIYGNHKKNSYHK